MDDFNAKFSSNNCSSSTRTRDIYVDNFASKFNLSVITDSEVCSGPKYTFYPYNRANTKRSLLLQRITELCGQRPSDMLKSVPNSKFILLALGCADYELCMVLDAKLYPAFCICCADFLVSLYYN